MAGYSIVVKVVQERQGKAWLLKLFKNGRILFDRFLCRFVLNIKNYNYIGNNEWALEIRTDEVKNSIREV
ncbi:hypothetical protein MAR_000097 [Mya arenaria]|uniref:Uncharacterized protein n=1 Tax=Mya arenaria TaxID=6604 RepID=A0ABY7FBT8_MYAAR|nr:hypothetical protein MAR_000097 [Mya arenaria]